MNATQRRRCQIACGLMMVLATGCSLVSRRNASESVAGGTYRQASLHYQLMGDELNKAFQNAAPNTASAAAAKWSLANDINDFRRPVGDIGTLVIEYPHPSGSLHYAQAKFEFVAVSEKMRPTMFFTGWKPNGQDREEWILDIPKQELDEALRQLNHQGYFAGKNSRTSAIRLITKVDNRRRIRRWDQIPQLNLLMRRCRQVGRPTTERAMKVAVARRVKQEKQAVFQHYAQQIRQGYPPPGMPMYRQPQVGAPAMPPARLPMIQASPDATPYRIYNYPNAYVAPQIPARPPPAPHVPPNPYGPPVNHAPYYGPR